MNRLDAAVRRIQRTMTLGPGAPSPERVAVSQYPRRRRRGGASRATAAITIALLLPIGFGAALIPMRDQLSQSVSLLMMLPVLVVALLGGRRLGIIAALAAAVVFDIFHTRPFYRPAIDDADDIVETVVLLVVGITIGYIAELARDAITTASVRHRELSAVTSFLDHVGTPISAEALAEHARASIIVLLGARHCAWRPDYKGTASPVLRPDGTLTSVFVADPDDDHRKLPATIELPVGNRPHDYGRFIVSTDRRVDVSLEERRAAASVAAAFGRCIGP